MAFANFYLTNKGAALLAKAQASKTMTFTRAQIGSGDVPDGTNIVTTTALYTPVKYVPIAGITSAGNQTQIKFQMTNSDITVPFQWKEFGLFANDPDEGEILYLYANAGVDADTFPAYNTQPIEFLFTIFARISNTVTVQASIDSSLIYVLKSEKDMAGGYAGYDSMQAALASKVSADSPTFTGVPKAPTPAVDTSTTQLATTAFVTGQAATTAPSMDGAATVGTSKRFARADHVHPTDTTRAPIASPAFTGTPTAPTAVAGANNTQIATTAFVASKITALVNSSPEALDTLNELAAALGNDPNFATTITNLISAKAPINSPELTGTPKAPTAASGTNTTQLATTAFVKSAVDNKTSVSGNAGTATKLQTARTISLTGEATGSASFDGSADAALNVSVTAINGYGTDNGPNSVLLSGRKSGTVIGEQSTAEGSNTEASADFSHAEGTYTSATGDYSHAEGSFSKASGVCAHSEGQDSVASGDCSHAEGYFAKSQNYYAHAEGYQTKASGEESHAEGSLTAASGGKSHAEGHATYAGSAGHSEGNSTIASLGVLTAVLSSDASSNSIEVGYIPQNLDDGAKILIVYSNDVAEENVAASVGGEGFITTANAFSESDMKYVIVLGDDMGSDVASGNHAEGYYTKALGLSSHASGRNTRANVFAGTAMGLSNNPMSGYWDHYSGTADALAIGNGDEDGIAPSNAFRVTFDGKVYGLSAFNSSGADYSEFFEWLDGNPNAEDRVGRFVALDGEKIKYANDGDYIIGIVSGDPAIVGDHPSESWKNRWVTDVYGRVQYHEVTISEKTETITLPDGTAKTVTYPARTDIVPVVNPEFDPSKIESYQNREKRPEWATVGMLGKLVCVDDGTCQENGYCKPVNGIATASGTGYRVLARLDATHIKVLIK